MVTKLLKSKVNNLMNMIDELGDLVDHVHAIIAQQPKDIREFLETNLETKLLGTDPYADNSKVAWN